MKYSDLTPEQKKAKIAKNVAYNKRHSEKRNSRAREKYTEDYTKEKWKEATSKYRAKPGVKESIAIKARAYRQVPEVAMSIENRRLLRTYGITIEDYNSLLIKQDGRCAICGTHQVDLGEKLVIDHNHTTGVVRGLLCRTCNQGLGLLKDNAKILAKASEYVQAYDWS